MTKVWGMIRTRMLSERATLDKTKKAALCAAALSAIAASSSAQEQIRYTYDDLGRLTSACDLSTAKLETYQFDSTGNRTNVGLTSNACGTTSLSIGDATAVAEGGSLSFTVTRSGNLTPVHTVDFAAAAGTASAADFTATSGTLTFATNETTKTVTVATINDTVYENSQTVLVNLSNQTAGVTITDSQGSGAINNNDAAPTFAIANDSATAGGNLSFTITKSGSTEMSHSVSYATANGTAIAGTHYTAASGQMTFAFDKASKNLTISTTSGSVTSGSKNMVVNISSATNNATITDTQGAGTINAPVNNPPVAVNDSVSGSFNVFDTVAVYVRTNDSDPDNDPLTVTGVGCISGGCTAAVAGGGTYITVRGNTRGTKTVSYTISDGKGGTDTAQATVGTFEDWCSLC